MSRPCTLSMSFLLLQPLQGTVLGGTEDADYVRSEIVRACDRVKSLYIKYRVPYDKPPFNEGVPPGFFLQRVIAVRSPDLFFMEQAHGTADQDWREDASRVRFFVGARQLVVEYPALRTYETWDLPAVADLPDILSKDMYFLASGWWPANSTRRPLPMWNGWSPAFCDRKALASYMVRKQQELVDGRSCHVLQKPDSEDTVWVDGSRACCLVQRRVLASAESPLEVHISLGGYREASIGVWVPKWFRLLYYDGTALGDKRGTRVVLDAKCTVQEARVNDDVPSDVFRFVAPPGAVRVDPYTGKTEQTEPGGFDYLEEMARSLEKAFQNRPEKDHSSLCSPATVITAVGITLTALLYIVSWNRKTGPRVGPGH